MSYVGHINHLKHIVSGFFCFIIFRFFCFIVKLFCAVPLPGRSYKQKEMADEIIAISCNFTHLVCLKMTVMVLYSKIGLLSPFVTLFMQSQR